ncbi:MAG: HU family DNA-binding protein [Azospirillaceae bacterium]|nr:HU family DNA-binding protein [Azospirillaceae bacterium]
MNKAELIDALCGQVNPAHMRKSDVIELIDQLAPVIQAGLAKDGRVTLPGVAIISVKDVPARTGRNPKTGEPIEIPGKRKAVFKAVKGFLA